MHTVRGRKKMANAALYKSCENWIHGSCAKIKRVTNGLAMDLNVGNAKGVTKMYEIRKKNCIMM